MHTPGLPTRARSARRCERKRGAAAPGGPCREARTHRGCSEHKGLLRACGRGARERLCTAVRAMASQGPVVGGGPREVGLAPGWDRSSSNELTSEGRVIRKGLRFNKLAALFGRKFWLSNSKACLAVTVPSRGLSGRRVTRCRYRVKSSAGCWVPSRAGGHGGPLRVSACAPPPLPAPVAVSAHARTHLPRAGSRSLPRAKGIQVCRGCPWPPAPRWALKKGPSVCVRGPGPPSCSRRSGPQAEPTSGCALLSHTHPSHIPSPSPHWVAPAKPHPHLPPHQRGDRGQVRTGPHPRPGAAGNHRGASGPGLPPTAPRPHVGELEAQHALGPALLTSSLPCPCCCSSWLRVPHASRKAYPPTPCSVALRAPAPSGGNIHRQRPRDMSARSRAQPVTLLSPPPPDLAHVTGTQHLQAR